MINMDLESTIVTINNLLKLDFESSFSDFIQPQKQLMAIPDYQREYKWEKSKIKTFVDNVMQRSKFLGIITAEAPISNFLSLVDGQQRLTTIILMLAQLYNACADEDETETQDEIEALITCEINGHRVLKLENGSVGEYLHFVREPDNKRRINLDINSAVDIYKQSSKFKDAWNIIGKEIYEMRQRNPDVTLDVYKQQLLDCKILLFAQKNTANMQQGSSEEIYIDINEKAQKLDPEDIFKGHCFAICKTVQQQDRVKILWRSIKQKFFSMDQIFKKADMGVFLHFYLLTQEATKTPRQDIKKDLTISGENVITQRYNTPTKVINLLKDMETYQKNLLDFVSKLSIIRYQYAEIMNASAQDLGNNGDRIKEFASILTNIITCNQNLFKLPLFYLIDKNYRKEPADKLSYNQLSVFIYLYYVYMFLFSRLGGSRKREDLANDIVNQSHNILWRSAAYDEAHPDPNFEHSFTMNDFRMCPAWVGPNNCWANFIWIDKDFNRDSLKNKDIINKIIILRGTYVASEAPHNGTYAKKHSHIEIICQHIMKTNGYGELLTAYNNNAPRADVLRRYQTFINNYFSEDSLKELQDTLTNEFVQKLQELYQMI